MLPGFRKLSAPLFLLLALLWPLGLVAHDGLAHAGEWDHCESGADPDDDCDLFHHAFAQLDAATADPAPGLPSREELDAPAPGSIRARLLARGCDRGPPDLV
jgi:hypothetical protein